MPAINYLKILVLVSAGTFLCACQKNTDTAQPKGGSPASAAAAKPREFLLADWRSAFSSTFQYPVGYKPKIDADGISESFVCFGQWDPKPCPHFLTAISDEVRRTTQFYPVHSNVELISGSRSTHLKLYAVAVECQPISRVLGIHYADRGQWLFLSRLTVVADGETKLDVQIDTNQVHRAQVDGQVVERATEALKQRDLESIASISAESRVVIRIAGSQGYITLNNKKAQNFLEDAKDLVTPTQMLDKAFVTAGGPKCA